jgi:hypothetical protein
VVPSGGCLRARLAADAMSRRSSRSTVSIVYSRRQLASTGNWRASTVPSRWLCSVEGSGWCSQQRGTDTQSVVAITQALTAVGASRVVPVGGCDGACAACASGHALDASHIDTTGELHQRRLLRVVLVAKQLQTINPVLVRRPRRAQDCAVPRAHVLRNTSSMHVSDTQRRGAPQSVKHYTCRVPGGKQPCFDAPSRLCRLGHS